jgi:hypothetical protein
MLPTIKLGSYDVTRLICGGNPFSGFSHVSAELDDDMLRYYTMPRLQAALDECWRNGINTLQSRGDRHQMRAYLEHRENGGRLHWIAQTASELASIPDNIAQIARSGAIAIYNHGSQTDSWWHEGKIDQVEAHIKCIKDHGLLAGVGTHIPEVIAYVEDKGWEVDFYMACFYNLARGFKAAPAVDRDAYAQDRFPAEDPDRMTVVMRQTRKSCLGFKILAASRNCGTPQQVKETFRHAFVRIKPSDAVVVGMFQKYRNQVAENAAFVREILGAQA